MRKIVLKKSKSSRDLSKIALIIGMVIRFLMRKRGMITKKLVSIFLTITILISLFSGFPIVVHADGENAIAIMVEQNSFNNSNVGGDGENALLWKKGDATLSGGRCYLPIILHKLARL